MTDNPKPPANLGRFKPMVDTLLQIVGVEADVGDWARVAAAVDMINDGRMH